jgi:hypothetical protein
MVRRFVSCTDGRRTPAIWPELASIPAFVRLQKTTAVTVVNGFVSRPPARPGAFQASISPWLIEISFLTAYRNAISIVSKVVSNVVAVLHAVGEIRSSLTAVTAHQAHAQCGHTDFAVRMRGLGH